ncbi:MAG: multiprotein bridging factor aMBF1 [Candidatus Altiarchaeota archaeon]|nr:multiprotein bridging factor aMBF1 [Candidatus Altiarchaeota archaeon]
MQCEICGKYIREGKRVEVEGSIIVTCEGCCSCGKVVGEVKKEVKKEVKQVEPLREDVNFEIGSEGLIEDYAGVIREAREKRGMKQKDLAASINEPISLIHRIESGRLKPSNVITRKIQGKLRVKLLEKSSDLGNQEVETSALKELTLGDLVVVRKRSK